jgi:TetR/AcrR family transcriptional regulator, repressor for neighboring sulfatase
MTRERRTPDHARAVILDAAERVFTTVMPDQVGLRDIAREAGISHALVTHYFGTYDGLVSATLHRRITAARELALSQLSTVVFSPGEAPMIRLLLEIMQDVVMVRLIGWAIMTGRRDQLGAAGGLQRIVDGLEERARGLGLPVPPRAKIEFAVAAAFAMAFGFTVANHELGVALGRDGALGFEEIRAEMPKLFWAYFASQLRTTAQLL